jgi:hypothetical protein
MGRPTNAEIEARKAESGEPETQTPADALAAALLEAVSKLAPRESGGGITVEQLETVLKSNAEATRKALKPENAQHPDVSAFNPLGERDHPRPKLRRKTSWAGTWLHEDDLMAEEIELFNAVDHTLEARNGAWRAELKRTASDGTSELHITFPCVNTDDRMDLPSMKMLMRELLGGTKAVDAESLAARVAQLEQQLAGTAA